MLSATNKGVNGNLWGSRTPLPIFQTQLMPSHDPSKIKVDCVFRCRPDYEDAQLAYEILNLHATVARPNPTLPSQHQFVQTVNVQRALICPTRFDRYRGRKLSAVGSHQENCCCEESHQRHPDRWKLPEECMGSYRPDCGRQI